MGIRPLLTLSWVAVSLMTACAMPEASVEEGTVSQTSPAELPVAEVVATFDQRPGNPSITPDGRILTSIHPLDQPDTKIVEVQADGSSVPYPSAEFVSGEDSVIQAIIAIRTDDQGVAWMLDLGAKRLIAWDTRTETEVKAIAIPESVLTPTSFLQDFALDQQRNRAIIADMTQGDLTSVPSPAFVVVDLETGDAQRIAENHPSMLPEAEDGFALNPITIDPAYEWVYFGALNGKMVHRVPAASFDGEAATVASDIEAYGPKPFSDGISVDSAGNVYVTDIEAHAIGVTTPEGYRLIANLPPGQTWPDGFAFGPDDYLYAVVNQLERSAALNDGKEEGMPPFQIVKIKGLAESNTGR